MDKKQEEVMYGNSQFEHRNTVWGYSQGPFRAPEHALNAFRKMIREQNLIGSSDNRIKESWVEEVNRRVEKSAKKQS